MSCCSSKSETPPRPPSSAIDNGICFSRFCGRDLRFSLSALHGLEGVELRFTEYCSVWRGLPWERQHSGISRMLYKVHVHATVRRWGGREATIQGVRAGGRR